MTFPPVSGLIPYHFSWAFLSNVNPLHSGAFVAYSGVTLVSFRLIAVSFQLVPVYSETILVPSVSFRRHFTSFRYIPVYSVPFLCLVTPLVEALHCWTLTLFNKLQICSMVAYALRGLDFIINLAIKLQTLTREEFARYQC